MFQLRSKEIRLGILGISMATIATLGTLGFPQAFATNYWSGWWWSLISHQDEFEQVGGNWRVPYAHLHTQLAGLPWTGGDPNVQAPAAVDTAANAWNGITSAWGLVNDDTQTSIHDQTVGTENLGTSALAHTHVYYHGYPCTFCNDSHLVDNDIHINNYAAYVLWDDYSDNQNTNPRTYELRKVMINEFGHWVSLCDTYSGSQQYGRCTGVVTSSSVMYSYRFGTAGRTLYTHDIDSVIGAYGG